MAIRWKAIDRRSGSKRRMQLEGSINLLDEAILACAGQMRPFPLTSAAEGAPGQLDPASTFVWIVIDSRVLNPMSRDRAR